ncbi:hypothetical protein GCM10010435_69340 [Winogradskya consettensis]|uniref:DUF4071 domain-containing protein n=1 Tax=Winogradskya consettensis TaxID=113560 RepID=A0A919SKS3_9ACTN|nr:tetratricopeptide repeat-containing protein [Actinoplanes consettensis]GIM73476.1 hypothetical protein Aco04nite_35440 [Actinoplanes consettensis]
MIIIYGGAADTQDTSQLRDRVERLIRHLGPARLVGGLVTDAELMVAAEGLKAGREVLAVVPDTRDAFRAAMAAEHGDAWTRTFDQLLDAPRLTLRELTPGETLLDVAAEAAGDEQQWLVTIGPRDAEPAGEAVRDLIARAQQRGLLTLDLSPVRREQRAFVVMPYGSKKDAESGAEIDCDCVFDRVYVPLLEDADLDWSRADLGKDTGIIHPSMLAELANCDVVLVDLTTTNFNVAYELGVRHVFAAASTMLVGPHIIELGKRTPPFDIAMSRVHSFDRGLHLTDEQATEAIRKLGPVLELAVAKAEDDSPAHAWFAMVERSAPLLLHNEVREREARFADAHRRVADATRFATILDTARWLDTAGLGTRDSQALRIKLGAALLGIQAYAEALQLFDRSQPEVGDPQHKIWLLNTVMAYRRLSEQTGVTPQEKLAHVDRAQRLLEKAVRDGYGDSETYGIWGGMIKREIQSAGLPREDPRTRELFTAMAEKYREGFDRDPSYYTGINLLLAMRLCSPERDGRFHDEFTEIGAATRLFANRALRWDRSDVWARLTLAELALHQALENTAPDLTGPAALYLTAFRTANPDQIASARNQLEFLRTYDSFPTEITTLLGHLDQR